MTEAFPLHWPAGYPRTLSSKRGPSPFRGAAGNQNAIQKEMMEEIRRMRGTDIIVSTNIELRRDGMPYASQKKVMEDPGVAVYFKRKGKDVCFACDSWATVAENMRSITKTIDALRGIERWGSGDMLERAFMGFAALPAPGPTKRLWWVVFEMMHGDYPLEKCEEVYRIKARQLHPDNGGDADAMAELNQAREEMRKAKGAS